MATISELLKKNKKKEIWDEYCGFLDLNVARFMAIQRRLLEEQLAIYPNCELGRRIFRGEAPRRSRNSGRRCGSPPTRTTSPT